MPSHRGAAVAIAVWAASAGAAPPPAVNPPVSVRPRAILLVTVDTLRADAVTFDGGSAPTTPFLARLADEGTSFDRAYATSSWTPPSMASIFTGVHGPTHGVVSGEISEQRVLRQPVLPASLTTLAEAARAAGYSTLGVPSNRHLARELGFAQGFDRYADADSFLGGTAVNERLRALLREELGDSWATAWREHALFVWLHYFDPHDPYVPYEPWLARNAPGARSGGARSPARKVMRDLRRLFPAPDAALAEAIWPLYRSEVARVDDLLAALWRELAPDDDTLVLFTADHGEEIVDHGGLGHSQSLYEELVRVPLVARWPRGIPAGRRITTPVSLVDLLPTLLDWMGAPRPPEIAARSWARLWRAETAAKPVVFLELYPPKPHRLAVVEGDWKLIVDPADRTRIELYDLARDPREKTNRAAEEGARVKAMRDHLRSWFRALPKAPDREIRESSDQKLIEQLRALGYIDG